MGLAQFSGYFNAAAFAYGVNPQVPPLQVINGPAVTGVGTLTLVYGSVATQDGHVFSPLNTNASILVGGNSNIETVTLTAVSNTTPLIYGSPTVTGNFTFLHGNGDQIRSGTVGLQEALNYAGTYGGGVVIIDAGWTKLGGTTAMINAATIPVGVAVQDIRLGSDSLQTLTVALTLAQINNAFTTSVLLVPAAGTGTMIDVQDAIFDLVFGTNAFSTGGAAQLSYNTGVTIPATATVAASVYTGLAANTIQKVAGVAAASTSSNYLNKGIYYANATGAFGAGTGCSANISVNYKVVSGLV